MSGPDDRGFRWPDGSPDADFDGAEVVAADLSYADTAPRDDLEPAAEQSTSDDASDLGALSGDAEPAVDSAAAWPRVSDDDAREVSLADESSSDDGSMVDGPASDDVTMTPGESSVDSPAAASDEVAAELFEMEAPGAESFGVSDDQTGEGSEAVGAVAGPPAWGDDGDIAEASAEQPDIAEYEAAHLESGVAADFAAADAESAAADVESGLPEAETRDAEAVALDAEAADVDSEAVGDPAAVRVLALRQRLAELDDLPTAEHAERYEALHAELTGALAQIDRAPDGGA